MGIRPANIGAVFRSERINGFHVVHFILGEEAMTEFHDNDLILLSKTDPTVDDELEGTEGDGGTTATATATAAGKGKKSADDAAEAVAVAATAAAEAAEAAEAGKDDDHTGAVTGSDSDADADGKETEEKKTTTKKEATTTTTTRVEDRREEDPNVLSRIYALGYVDGRDSRNRMRVRFYLPENVAKMSNKTAGGEGKDAGSNPEGSGANAKGRAKAKAAADAKRKKMLQQHQEEHYLRFRAVRNALASPGSAWYLMHLANMSTIAREWLALHAFPSLPFAPTILSGKPVANAVHASWELPAPLSKAMEVRYNGEAPRPRRFIRDRECVPYV